MKKMFNLYILILILFTVAGCKNLLNDSIERQNRKVKLELNRINNFGATGQDRFYEVIESGDYYISVGRSNSNLSALPGGNVTQGTYDFVIAKFNKSDLSIARINNFGGSDYDSITSVIESGDYYIAVGRSKSDLSGLTGGSINQGWDDFVIAKFNKSDLSLVDINNIGGDEMDDIQSVIESGDDYIAVGYSYSDLSGLYGGNNMTAGSDFVIARFNKSNLSLVNINNIGGSKGEYFHSIIESGDYYITVGGSESNLTGLAGGSLNQGDMDFVIARFRKTDLSLEKINNFGGLKGDNMFSLIESGDYYIASGESESDLMDLKGGSANRGEFDFVIAKFSKSDLSLVNINNTGGVYTDTCSSVIESGDYYITAGYSVSDLSALPGSSSNFGNTDFVIGMFNKSNLELETITNLGGTSNDYFLSVIKSDGYYITAGYSYSDLSSLQGGNVTKGSTDFVISRFEEIVFYK
ncbi:hypothetical protein ACFL20_10180 [Spirochaetota bacterium]